MNMVFRRPFINNRLHMILNPIMKYCELVQWIAIIKLIKPT